MKPTSIALTSTLCGAPSCESTLVSAMPAARVIEVGALPPRGALAPMLSTLMMRPQRRSFICGHTSRVSRMAANSFWSKSCCRNSSVSFSNEPVARRAGIVHEDVDLAERLHYFVVGTLDIGGARHVALDADHPPAIRPDGLDRMIERFAPARDNGNLGARGCKPLRDGEPDALASAGDHRGPAGETDVHSYPPARASTAGASRKSYSPRRAGKSGRDASPHGE